MFYLQFDTNLTLIPCTINTSTDATNLDADNDSKDGAPFSRRITVFREKLYQPLNFNLPTRMCHSDPKECPLKPQ